MKMRHYSEASAQATKFRDNESATELLRVMGSCSDSSFDDHVESGVAVLVPLSSSWADEARGHKR